MSHSEAGNAGYYIGCGRVWMRRRDVLDTQGLRDLRQELERLHAEIGHTLMEMDLELSGANGPQALRSSG